MFHPVAHIHTAVGDGLQPPEAVLLRSVGEGFAVDSVVLLQACDVAVTLMDVLGLVVAGFGRDEEGHHDTGHRGVDAAVIEEHPHCESAHQVREHTLLSKLFEHEGESYHYGCDSQEQEVDASPVEEGDHKDGYEVVGDCKCGQEDFQ